MRRFAALAVLIFAEALVSCETAAQREVAVRMQYNDRLERMGTGPGAAFRHAAAVTTPVRRFEAYQLAGAYFLTFVMIEGGANVPEDDGTRWIARTVVGPAAADGPLIYVQKTDGLTYVDGGKRVRPHDFLRYYLAEKRHALH